MLVISSDARNDRSKNS